jgi:hypothetical protein
MYDHRQALGAPGVDGQGLLKPENAMNPLRLMERYFESRPPRLDLLIFAALLALSWSVYKWSDHARWAEHLGLAAVFCALIWLKDDSPAGRWLIIGIIAVGTLLSIVLSW